MLVVPAGSLDTALAIAPDANIFTASKAAWDHDLASAPDFEAFPSQAATGSPASRTQGRYADRTHVQQETTVSLTINSLKPYVPARDFELCKRFYTTLGFSMTEGWGGTADFSLNGSAFRLQNYFVQDWADNFMFVMGVDDVEAWHQRALELLDSGAFSGMRVQAPAPVDGAMVLHVIDPSGVLLVFVQ
jgi:hypothetical protein